MEHKDRRWLVWFLDLAKFCAALTVVGSFAYFLFGIRFVSRAEYERHLEFARSKIASYDAIDSTQLQQNRQILTNLTKLNDNVDELNNRLVRLEIRLERVR